ncbi:putative secreted protein [Wickerhamomyces ciferrii]|uniref:Secreted protein n=1 Tax=Wickerhamomyces ciferrii (strain ATCC 14091 / BCRC 22168 / CBS 111 / JCM 3599 / NBRC 0793 / NRRL Y-1031 F-60-10) TaxID=1206466 RepID=K0L089_WICCF|nr:uncharacterized protein BN7_6633 [Wickerhamomyces ciferrii]CCH47024.1 putative secreted protein [Wickerhamomyces ciferrii]
MKLSTVILQGLLLSGIIATPVAIPDAAEDSIFTEGLDVANSDNSTDFHLEGDQKGLKICQEANKGKYCFKDDINGACVEGYKKRAHMTEKDAKKACKFWCSKIKNADTCRKLKVKYDYHPKFKCSEQNYC